MGRSTKFYEKKWFMWIMLIFVAPAGILLLWRGDRYNKNVKFALSGIFSLVFLLIVIPDFLGINKQLNTESNIRRTKIKSTERDFIFESETIQKRELTADKLKEYINNEEQVGVDILDPIHKQLEEAKEDDLHEITMENGQKILKEDDFWDYVDKSLKKAIEDTGLVIYNKQYYPPYMNYYVTAAEDGKEDEILLIKKLPYEEYLSAVDTLKVNLNLYLDDVILEEPKSFFSYPACDILSLKFFTNDIDDTYVSGLVPVGSYQIRVVDYYYEDDHIQIDYLKEFKYK